LEECGRLHPEVIVTDISMPVMDGFEAVATLRRGATPKVVFLTVHECNGHSSKKPRLWGRWAMF
jgi:CheY-like chemotaxis protein